MTLLVWQENAISPWLLCYATVILAFHHCTGSKLSASRGRVLAFYRIAPCLTKLMHIHIYLFRYYLCQKKCFLLSYMTLIRTCKRLLILTSVKQHRMYFLVTTRTFLGLPVEQISSFQERCFTLWRVKRLPRIWPVYTKWNLPSRSFIKFSAGGKLLLTLKCNLSLYSLRLRAVFPKSANKDTLPVYNIPFESHWAAYLRTDISSYEGGRHFERNCFKMQTEWLKICINLLL